MIVSNGDTQREWEIYLILSDGSVETVEHLFDRNGNETFDPTEAVEAHADGEIRIIEAGDTLQFELMAD